MNSIIGSTKGQFTDQVGERLWSLCREIDTRGEAAYDAALKKALYRVAEDPDYAGVMDDLSAVIGGDQAIGVLNAWNPQGNRYRGYEMPKAGGRLGAIVERAGLPKLLERDATRTALADEFLYLTGAFGTTKIKFWDGLYPPTRVFVEGLKKPDLTLEELRAVILAFVEALRVDPAA